MSLPSLERGINLATRQIFEGFLQIANKMVLGKWPYLDPDKAEGKGRKVKIRRGARKGKS